MLLVGATVCTITTQTENIQHLEYRVVSEGTVRMLSRWVVETRHLP
jgi:hypothetical protein